MHMKCSRYLFHLELIFYNFHGPTLPSQPQTSEIQHEDHSRHRFPVNLGHLQVSITQVSESYIIPFCLSMDACCNCLGLC
jgi:hypothetical protein